MRDGDETFMFRALELAQQAERAGEVPVGAIVVLDNSIIGEGFNCPIAKNDPTAHAECNALRDASRNQGNYRLPGATLYVTLEPCLMCVGAIVHARIARLVYGTVEPKSGAVVSNVLGFELPHLNHSVEVSSGILESRCRELIQEFFRRRRGSSSSDG